MDLNLPRATILRIHLVRPRTKGATNSTRSVDDEPDKTFPQASQTPDAALQINDELIATRPQMAIPPRQADRRTARGPQPTLLIDGFRHWRPRTATQAVV